MSGFRFVVEVEPGCMGPRGYGRAWNRWDRNIALFMPVPLNFVAGMLRSCWMWLARGFPRSGYSPRFADAINYGRKQGYSEGYAHGRTEARAEARVEYARGWNDGPEKALAELGKRT